MTELLVRDAERRLAIGAGLRAVLPPAADPVLPGAAAGPAAGAVGLMCTPGCAEASVPPCGSLAWQPPAVHWLLGTGALKCSTVRDMLAARKAATTTPRPAANVGVTASLRNAGLSRRPPGRRRAFGGRCPSGRAPRDPSGRPAPGSSSRPAPG